jgi:transcriptional regulator with XRE-family HTH domain/tetratricopeptide (TPR) repeat protein
MANGGLGERLRELRLAAGLTIEALAEASGVSVRAISDTERGRSRAPQPRTVAALSAGLGLTRRDADELAERARAGRETVAPAGRPRACDLPRRSVHFVGRDAELAAFGERVGALPPDGPALVAVLHGPPGVGKTALAIRVAEQHRDRFPDGVHYLDLRGTDPHPLAAAEAQAVLLKAFGVGSRQIAPAGGERAGQLRGLLERRRCLVILDNAGGEGQVRDILPGAGAGCVLVTSRRALTGLEAVHRLALAPLGPEESAALLHTVAASAGTAAEVETVTRLCGHLPLALTIAGGRLADASMSRLIADLSDAERRLATLTSRGFGVEAAFAVSYVQLPEATRTVFRRLAHVPTVSFSAAAAAVLAERDLFDAEDHLEELLDLGLLQPEGGDRYRFHDLIRLYAVDRLRAEEPPAVRAAAERRLTDWYLDTAIAAGRWFEPQYGTAPPDWHHPVPLDTPEQAQAWLQVEFDGWLEAMRRVTDPQRVVDVAEALHWYSDRTFSVDPWSVVYGLSRAAAARLPDRRQEVTHVNYLSWALSTCDGRYAEGAATALEAHRLAVDIGDVKEQAWALRYAADAYTNAGRMDAALDALRRALPLAEACGDHDGYVQMVVATGTALLSLDRAAEAAEEFRRCLAEVERRPLAAAPAQVARVTATLYLGRSLVAARRWPEALAAARDAVELGEGFGERRLIAQARVTLGEAYAGLGDTARARAEVESSLRVLRSNPSLHRFIAKAEAALAKLESA